MLIKNLQGNLTKSLRNLSKSLRNLSESLRNLTKSCKILRNLAKSYEIPPPSIHCLFTSHFTANLQVILNDHFEEMTINAREHSVLMPIGLLTAAKQRVGELGKPHALHERGPHHCQE